jgi:hypothetical protein
LNDPQNKDIPTIVETHGYLQAGTSGLRPTWGQPWWDEVIKGNPQVFMVLCGDGGENGGVAHQTSFNDANKPVLEIEADYQNFDEGGNGYLRLMEFDEANNMIHVRTYSPYLDQYLTDAGNQFDLSMNFDERLGLLGDANGDGTVNGADLNTVLSNYNHTGQTWAHGDFNGDGTINGADLNAVLSHYNQHVSVGAAATEPSAVVLLAIVAISLLCYAWRRHRA